MTFFDPILRLLQDFLIVVVMSATATTFAILFRWLPKKIKEQKEFKAKYPIRSTQLPVDCLEENDKVILRSVGSTTYDYKDEKRGLHIMWYEDAQKFRLHKKLTDEELQMEVLRVEAKRGLKWEYTHSPNSH